MFLRRVKKFFFFYKRIGRLSVMKRIFIRSEDRGYVNIGKIEKPE